LKLRVLCVYYSQTGQLRRALESLADGLDPGRFEITFAEIRARTEYPFPWPVGRFFDVFPDSVLGRSPEIEPLPFDPGARYDLVILGYTVWFLAPSLPVQGFFASPYVRVLKDTPVVTLIACRNMWHTASERMKRMIAHAGGRHVDNVVVTDQGSSAASFVTTPRWMFTGRRDAFWRVFPAAGVSEEQLAGLARFGKALSEQHATLRTGRGPFLAGLDAVKVDSKLIIPELIGRVSFPAWATWIAAVARVSGVLSRLLTLVFVCYLVLAILILVPASIIARLLLYPVLAGRLRAYVRQLESPSGGGRPAVETP
jgi:hypothetical protein